MLLVLFKLFFTQISQNSRIFYQARNHIIPASSHLSVLSCDVAHRFTQIFTDFYLTTTGTTITTHRSKTNLDLCHLCNLCELLYTNDLELTMKKYKFIFDNLWKFTGISVVLSIKHKLAQMTTNYQKFFYSSRQAIINSQFSILNSMKAGRLIIHYQLSIINCQKAATSRRRRSRRRRSRRHRPMRHGRRHRKSGWYCCPRHATSR